MSQPDKVLFFLGGGWNNPRCPFERIMQKWKGFFKNEFIVYLWKLSRFFSVNAWCTAAREGWTFCKVHQISFLLLLRWTPASFVAKRKFWRITDQFWWSYFAFFLFLLSAAKKKLWAHNIPLQTNLTSLFQTSWPSIILESPCPYWSVGNKIWSYFHIYLLLQSQFSIFWSGSHSSMVAAAAVLNSSPTVGGDGGNILWALCCIFGQFPSAQPSLSLANILLCSHHCHHPKFYHLPLIRWPEREAVVGTDFQIVASATKTHSQSQYWTECRAVVQFCKHFHVKY